MKIIDTGTKEETKETNASNPELGQFEVIKKNNKKTGRNKIKTNRQTYDLWYFLLQYILLPLRGSKDP